MNRLSVPIAFLIAILIFPLKTAFSEEPERPPAHEKDLIEVKVYNLVAFESQAPVVLLSDFDEKSAMPIWISPFEANAIYMELGEIKPPRPQTHELFKRVIKQLKGGLRRIVITHEYANIFYAKLILQSEGGLIEMDARPSDSIVLALKFHVPILVNKDLFAARSVPIEAENEGLREYGLTLQELSPALSQYFALGPIEGMLVADVRRESPAEKDGLKIKDVIVEINKKPVRDIDTIKSVFSKGAAEAEAKIYRANDFISLTLHLKVN